jgi:hypothetical protein
VKPRCAFLQDLETGEQIVVNMKKLAAERLARAPKQI